MAKKKDDKAPLEQRYQILPLDSIEANSGQIEGLPANPRRIAEEKFELLKKNITDYPELLDYRGLLVYPYGDKYITIGGNMRYQALSELGYTEAPCAVLPADTPVEKLKAYIILDNDNFGQWNWDMLTVDWDVAELGDFGIDMVGMMGSIDDLFNEEEEEKEKEDPLKITVTVPDSLLDRKEEIKDNIKSVLAPYDGVKVK